MTHRAIRVSILIFICAALTAGCAGPIGAAADPTPVPTPLPTAEPVTVLDIEAVADPPPADTGDPYADINPYTKVIYAPDRDLYNAVYSAAERREDSLDITGCALSHAEKSRTVDSLYGAAGFELFFLNRVKLSADGNTVSFTYRESAETARRDRETYDARLGHLLYNVAIEDYTDLQKLMAVYTYISETSGYTDDMGDEATMSPYSILVNGKGICGGYANLMRYALNRLGVKTEYVGIEAHAWDIVNLDGQWYHTDVTWGAGNYGDPYNSLHTFLMDDAARQRGLNEQGWGEQAEILGYPHPGAQPPPACTDGRFAQYGGLYGEYAVDIDEGKVYFPDGDEIKRMNLDCTRLETMAHARAGRMVFYDRVLYYVGAYDGFLYQLTPGHTPALVDNSLWVAYLALQGTSLAYGPNSDGTGCKAIRLAQANQETARYADMLPAQTVARGRSFRMEVTFSGKMDPSAHWEHYIYLLDGAGEAIPLHLRWSEDGRMLTVRPRECVADMGTVTLMVEKGAPAANGTRIARSCGRHMLIQSDCAFWTSKYREAQ